MKYFFKWGGIKRFYHVECLETFIFFFSLFAVVGLHGGGFLSFLSFIVRVLCCHDQVLLIFSSFVCIQLDHSRASSVATVKLIFSLSLFPFPPCIHFSLFFFPCQSVSNITRFFFPNCTCLKQYYIPLFLDSLFSPHLSLSFFSVNFFHSFVDALLFFVAEFSM